MEFHCVTLVAYSAADVTLCRQMHPALVCSKGFSTIRIANITSHFTLGDIEARSICSAARCGSSNTAQTLENLRAAGGMNPKQQRRSHLLALLVDASVSCTARADL